MKEPHNFHLPEGVSVMVVADLTDSDLIEVAQMIAAVEYPNIALTGRPLHVGRDEFDVGKHEVVLEVAQRDA